MNDLSRFSLHIIDYLAFGLYFIVLCLIGFWMGRKEKEKADDYFLAGRSLPWYVVGSSFIASNISTEHFIGMIGGAFVYGICVAMSEWLNVGSFTLLIWIFIPFLLSARVFTTPEFLEKRFNSTLRLFFAIVTVISNIVAFLAAVLYGGGLALHTLFGWNLWIAIVFLGVVAGSWAIYGGLKSVAWTDFFTVIVMIAGGLLVTVLGLYMLSGESHSLVEGFKVMIERNQAREGIWADVTARIAPHIVHSDQYNRLSVIQPITHEVTPWPFLLFGIFSISIWYNILNQFMIQRVLGAKNMYHARMGIVLAGYMKIFLPFIIVLPGLILFARFPEVLNLPWDEVKPEADKGYVVMLHMLIPIGLRGLFLAALFGAIQSTVNSVLNSTATVFTLDIYKRWIHKTASQKQLVYMGMGSSTVILILSIVLSGYISHFSEGLFVYIQSLYAFFAPPFSAVFLLGILFRRINSQGATAAVLSGFLLGIGMKVYAQSPGHALWLEPFAMQAIVNWIVCTVICAVVSVCTQPPLPEQVTDRLTLNWKRLNIFQNLGSPWHRSVTFWWALFVVIIFALILLFSGLFL
ncbi:MAG: sodium/solute symporter [Candidatus Omnitrophica bacterium]|nr:sodium/solute symporter [Candidatus Omnitrophota bacterium]